MPVAVDIVLVAATVICVLSLSSAIAAWTERRLPVVALVGFLAGAGVFVALFTTQPEMLDWRTVPDAFLSVAARVLN